MRNYAFCMENNRFDQYEFTVRFNPDSLHFTDILVNREKDQDDQDFWIQIVLKKD
jgi:hypothetical protein